MVGHTDVPDFRALFAAMPVDCLVVDTDLTVVDATDGYLRSTMSTREDIVGRPLFDVFPDNPDDPDATGTANLRSSLQRVLRSGRPDTMAVQQYDIARPAADGGGFEVRYWSPVNVPMIGRTGRVEYILHRVEDVTELVQLREHDVEQQELTAELQVRTARMQAEVLQRSRELDETNRLLRAANDAKSDFLSRMSHELRTPLTAILGFGEILSMSELDAERAHWLSMMVTAGRHLLAIVDDALDVSRIEAGHLALVVEPVALADVLHDAHHLVHPLASTRDVSIEAVSFDASTYVAADHQRLRQVLLNLLSNAIKFNRPGGSVTIEVVVTASGRARIGITDTGDGLTERDIQRLFVAFERLGASEAGIQGTGLGLVLSRDLVQRMGGTLEVSSVPGTGSTFWVELDTVEPAAVAMGTHHDSIEVRRYGRPTRVLYVEDVVANASLVEEILKLRPDVTLMTAMLGGIAVDLAREHVPDLVLLDLHLPDMGGQDVLARLRAHPATRDIPTVILTADVTARTRHLLAAEGLRHLTKPIGVRELLATLDAHLAGEPTEVTDAGGGPATTAGW